MFHTLETEERNCCNGDELVALPCKEHDNTGKPIRRNQLFGLLSKPEG